MGEKAHEGHSGPQEIPKVVTIEDVEPQTIGKGGTATFVARHGEYDRDEYVGGEKNPHFGSLTERGYESIKKHAREIFTTMLRSMPADERRDFCILLVASDADRGPGTGKRCVESARAWEEGAIEALATFGLPPDQILNPGEEINIFTPKGSKIGVDHELVGDPYSVSKETAAFMDWLVEQCKKDGDDRPNAHWIAYETDTYKDKRLEMGADGPLEVAERLCKFLTAQQELARNFHKKYPDRRLAVVNVAHTDNIHPLLKTAMSGHSDEVALQEVVNVEYGGGFSYATHADGTTTKPVIDGREYSIPHCSV